MSEFNISFRWVENDWSSSEENFFVGAWHPSATLNVKVMGGGVKKIAGDNWFILSSCLNDSAEKIGPLHGEPNQSGEYSKAILFSGYLLEPSLHTFSTSDKVFKYFSGSQPPDYNGVFSLVKIEESGKRIEIRSDAFGISPLYFRIYESMILFSSNPRFLRMENDSSDLLAWRCLIQSRALSSDRTLSNEIKGFLSEASWLMKARISKLFFGSTYQNFLQVKKYLMEGPLLIWKTLFVPQSTSV